VAVGSPAKVGIVGIERRGYVVPPREEQGSEEAGPDGLFYGGIGETGGREGDGAGSGRDENGAGNLTDVDPVHAHRGAPRVRIEGDEASRFEDAGQYEEAEEDGGEGDRVQDREIRAGPYAEQALERDDVLGNSLVFPDRFSEHGGIIGTPPCLVNDGPSW
jgi:hypothetical protein